MNRHYAVRLMGCLSAAFFISGCQSTTESPGDDVKTFRVGPSMKDGVGVGPMTCLMVMQPGDSEYKMFYSPIKGFDYVPGFEYELKVKVSERENVPADASKYQYDLVKVVSKTAKGLSIDSGAWKLKSYISVSGTMDPVVHKSPSFMKIADGKVSGNAGANNFFGDVSVDGTALSVKPVGSSMMMGTPELMAQEGQFLKLLGETVDYQIVGEELRLRNVEQKVVLVFTPRKEVALTGVKWRATGINNGKGGVSSLVADTKVTILFAEDGKVSGNSGCNAFSGSYELDGDSIKFSPLAGTRKMGPEPVMEQETNFLKALGNASVLAINGNQLELRNAEGALQVGFKVSEE